MSKEGNQVINLPYKEQYSATSFTTALAAPSRSSRRCSSIGNIESSSLASSLKSLDERRCVLKMAALKMHMALSTTSSSAQRNYKECKISSTQQSGIAWSTCHQNISFISKFTELLTYPLEHSLCLPLKPNSRPDIKAKPLIVCHMFVSMNLEGKERRWVTINRY